MNNDDFPDNLTFNESLEDTTIHPVNSSQNSSSSNFSNLPPQSIPYKKDNLLSNQLIALLTSALDAINLVAHIPELRNITTKIAFFEFIDSLIVSCNEEIEEIKKVWWNLFFYWFLIGVIIYFNSQSIKFLYVDPNKWPIPIHLCYIVGFGMVWLIDFAIKTLVSSELKVKFADDQKKALRKKLFSNPDHPLQDLYDRNICLFYEQFVEPFSSYPFKWLLLVLLGLILLGEALVTFHLLNQQVEDGIPWYLGLTPLLSSSLNILSGIYAGIKIEYPKELSVLKSKLSQARQKPFI